MKHESMDKCIKDPIEIHNIKQRDGESTKDFVRRYKLESRDVKGAPECMRISGFVHVTTNLELIKRLYDKIPKRVDEMIRVTTSFLRGEMAASNHERKKSFPPGTARGHNTNECMHLKKQIEEMLNAGKLSHLIKELKQNNGKEQPKAAKKGETSRKDKPTPSENQEPIIASHHPLIGFNGEIIWPIGQIQLLVRIGDEEHSTSAWMNFVVIRSPSPYNRIIGRPEVKKLQAVSSTTHGILKLPVEGGVITLKSNMMVPLKYMTGVQRHIAEHRLNVREDCSTVRQKKRGQAADRNQAIQEEVRKLVEAGIIKEVHYHDWLSNLVMVKKHDDSWRIVTYQRLVDQAFHKQIGRNLKVDVDDLVIKSRTENKIVRDIEETFKTLREINMKLNPKKCTFGVEEGMFLVQSQHRGLKTAEAEEAFKQMKQLIAELPMLAAQIEKEELIVYLAAAKKDKRGFDDRKRD
nr:hypothetical protein [Tanacetum cinerariifolium]